MPGAHKSFSASKAAGFKALACGSCNNIIAASQYLPSRGKLWRHRWENCLIRQRRPPREEEKDLRKLGSPGLPPGNSKCTSEDSWTESCCALPIRHSSALRRILHKEIDQELAGSRERAVTHHAGALCCHLQHPALSQCCATQLWSRTLQVSLSPCRHHRQICMSPSKPTKDSTQPHKQPVKTDRIMLV